MARILLIEDNRDHLELMAYLLRSHGHFMLSAGSAESGQTMMECCQDIDLIICDIRLGNASGIDLVRALRKSGRFSSVPIVAVTAGSMGQAHEAFAAGFNRYILKPIEPETFLAEINACLAGDGDPRFAPAAKPSTSPALAKELPDKQHATILAVDDKSANLDLISALLRPLGYRVITARGVEEALARARKDGPDLVLTDVHMGDGTGFDLIHAIQEDARLRHIAWLVTSATYLTMDARAKDLHLDDSNFILQPWEPQTFVAKIRNRVRGGKDVGAARQTQAGG
jgi:two-component system cell cycle response regulator